MSWALHDIQGWRHVDTSGLRPSTGILKASAKVLKSNGREPAGALFAGLDLHGRVADAEPLMQLVCGMHQKRVAGVPTWQDQMGRQHIFRRARRPDVQVMHLADARQAGRIGLHGGPDRCRQERRRATWRPTP
ncbi:hypothetical protein MESS2_740013 [Mesorhizobium metallidurans STM 2683]|uniref:Uncharacterized protein n=1 Tax=Mesorhizobium metallidurans STM 2683 TaxID=1297569 RepID=M5F920_9HYPH|nr:hypothetical protein MESS2_740013 [Mesorhizobium metallidurans STM 2683]